jgi:hypothetical protein
MYENNLLYDSDHLLDSGHWLEILRTGFLATCEDDILHIILKSLNILSFIVLGKGS